MDVDLVQMIKNIEINRCPLAKLFLTLLIETLKYRFFFSKSIKCTLKFREYSKYLISSKKKKKIHHLISAYGLDFAGLESVSMISCSTMEVLPGTSVTISECSLRLFVDSQ